MINRIKNIIDQLLDKGTFNKFRADFVQTQLNQGKIMGDINLLHKKDEIIKDIKKAEFKIFSQWGDDGIIHFLVNYLEIPNKIFIEFGVEDYTECNTRFLLMNDNWSGLIMDGSEKNMAKVRNEDLYWRFDLKAVAAFVTAENINQLITDNGVGGDIGILHIDIDGNDYWVWKAINCVNPVIVIIEYNSLFGYDKPWTVPYDPNFERNNVHYSNLFYGTSLLSFCDLAEEKGYAFIGCNSNGNNAYFVRKDKLNNLLVKTPRQGYVESKFSESRDKEGKLTFLRGQDRLRSLSGSTVFNTRNGNTETI